MWYLFIPFIIHILIWFFCPVYGASPFHSEPEEVRRETVEYALKYDTPLSQSRYEILKVILMTLCGLSIMRLIMMSICICIGALFINMGWETAGSTTFRMSLWWLGYYDISMKGGRLSSAPILVSNHCSGVLEPFILYDLAHCPSFVTRIENLSIPFVSGLVKNSTAIVVDRNNCNSRKQTLKDIENHVRDPSSRQLMIFPEGTCNNGKCLFRFNKGAFVAGLPVQPVVFNYPYKHFNAAYTGIANGGHNLPGLMWRTACQFVNRVEVKYLPVYYPSEKEKKDPILYAKNVQELIASHLHIPVTDATFADYKKAWLVEYK